MATTSIPLHTPPLSSLSLQIIKALPLLTRKITLYFGGADKKASSVVATVGEIYNRCQRTLSEKFGPTPLLIRGSAVSSLFSNEPFGDIDIHGTINETSLSKTERIRRGYSIKWAVLQGIHEIILAKSSPSPSGSKVSLDLEMILFDEVNVLFSSSGAAYNVHTIRIPGDIPLEFTVFNIVDSIEKSVRNYDFNSGSLELSIDDTDQVNIHSKTSDIPTTIKELERRELTCIEPEEITRKGICRYLAKVVLSGYYDKDKELLDTLVNGVKKRANEKNTDAILAAGIVKEILAHFKEKGVSSSAALLSLWLLPKKSSSSEIFTTLLKEVKEKLKATLLTTDPLPERAALYTLAENGKKAECSWYLMMQSKRIRKVLHRGEDSLQLEIPSYPIFADNYSDSSVFIIVPIEGLSKFSESIIPQGFFAIHQTDRPRVEVDEAETKTLLQALFKALLENPLLYPVLVTAIDRFAIDRDEDFSKLFIYWVKLNDAQPESKKLIIPAGSLRKLQPTLKRALEDQDLFKEVETMMKQDERQQPLPFFSMLKMLHTVVGKDNLCFFDSITLQKMITRITSSFFVNKNKFFPLSRGDEEIMLDFAKAHVEKICQVDKIREYIAMKEELHCKRALSILYGLFKQKHMEQSQGVRSVSLLFELGYESEGFAFLKFIIKESGSLEFVEIQTLFLELIESQPLKFSNFVRENAAFLKQKMDPFHSIIQPFLEKIIPPKGSEDLIGKFIEVVEALCDQEAKQNIIKNLFIRAAKGNFEIKKLIATLQDHFKLLIWNFHSIKEMNNDELIYLSKLEGFDLQLAKDLDFRMGLTNRALALGNVELASMGLVQLARTNPCECLGSLNGLDRLLKAPEHLTTLPASLTIITEILETDSKLVKNPQFWAFIEGRLEDLGRYLAAKKEGGAQVLNEKFLTLLQKLHRQVALYTIENPCWLILWEIVRASDKNKEMKDWVDAADLSLTLSEINPTGNIKTLIESFALDSTIVYEFIRQLSSLPKGDQAGFVPLIRILFRRGREALIQNPPKEMPVDALAVTSNINELYKIEKDKDTLDFFNDNMDFFLIFTVYWIIFRPLKEQEEILNKFDMMFRDSDSIVQLHLTTTSIPHNILFLLTKRAIERKDFAALRSIGLSYALWQGKEYISKYLCPDDYNSLCEQFQELFTTFFSDSGAKKNLVLAPNVEMPRKNDDANIFETLDSEAMCLYCDILSNGFNIQAIPPESKLNRLEENIKKTAFHHALEFISFITRKKLVIGDTYLTILFKNAHKLQSTQITLLVQRLMKAAIAIVEEIAKPTGREPDALLNRYLLYFVYSLVSFVEKNAKKIPDLKEISQKEIVHFLLLEQNVFYILKKDEFHTTYIMQVINFLEESLTKDAMFQYYVDWTHKLASSKEKVSSAEIIGWIHLTSTLDPLKSTECIKIAHRIAPSTEKFHNKLTQQLFYKPQFLREVITIIDRGFTNSLEPKTDQTESIVPVEDFVEIVRYLREKIFLGLAFIAGKNKSEHGKLLNLYIKALVNYLKITKTHSSLNTILDVCNLTINNPSASREENALYLYWSIHNIPLLTNQELTIFRNDRIKLFCIAYLKKEDIFKKVLSEEQIAEVKSILFVTTAKFEDY